MLSYFYVDVIAKAKPEAIQVQAMFFLLDCFTASQFAMTQ
jgi:hypothetical protein